MDLIDSTRPNSELWESIESSSERTRRGAPGRSANQALFLKRIEALAPQFGVTRVSDISWFSPIGMPVAQSCRPWIYSHTSFGQNTGAQGKGLDPIQARISCIMESLEAFSAEPRNARLIRGSTRFLQDMHSIADPNSFRWTRRKLMRVPPHEPLMWTDAVCLRTGQQVLIPAELVYVPFFPIDYKTRQIFPCDSNGLASGATYLEAVLAALYELIERHLRHLWIYHQECRVEAIVEDPQWQRNYRALLGRMGAETRIQAYMLRTRRSNSVPVALALLIDGNTLYSGTASHINPLTAVSKAVTEAIQVLATRSTGAREDMIQDFNAAAHREDRLFLRALEALPTRQTLDLKRNGSRFVRSRGITLREEFQAVRSWLHSAGYSQIYAVNLTRAGIDVPVVKVLVPGLLGFADEIGHRPLSTLNAFALSFGGERP